MAQETEIQTQIAQTIILLRKKLGAKGKTLAESVRRAKRRLPRKVYKQAMELARAEPLVEHPKRPVEGFDCKRSEVSGRRLWGLFCERFGTAEAFFQDHFVANYCPLVFMEASGRNRTPDKLPAEEVEALYKACDAHLQNLVNVLQPNWLIGVGAFAEDRARAALDGFDLKIGRVLHPSPASPAANRGWGEQATRQLEALGVWE